MKTARTERRLAEIQGQLADLLRHRPKDDFSFPIRYEALVKLEAALITARAEKPCLVG
jgi:hypothetical protein